MAINDFKKIRKFAKNSKCKVHITKKYGIRFFIYRHRKRKALIIGFVAFWAILWMLTQFVWVIDVTGNKKIGDEVILEYAKQAGLKAGMPVLAVDAGSVQRYIMTNMEDMTNLMEIDKKRMQVMFVRLVKISFVNN